MKTLKKLFPGLLLLLLLPVTARAAITTRAFTSHVVAGQAILPNWHAESGYASWEQIQADLDLGFAFYNAAAEGYIVIMGLNIASNSGQALQSVSIGMPAGYLDVNSTVLTTRGGTIIGLTPGVGFINIPGGAFVPANDTGGNAGDDFYVAIRVNDTAQGPAYHGFLPQSASFSGTSAAVAPVTADDVALAGATTPALTCKLDIADMQPQIHTIYNIGPNDYVDYPFWHPGQMIRPRYETDTWQRSPWPEERRVPQVLPWETRVAVLGVAAAQRNVYASGTGAPTVDTEWLDSITLTATDTGQAGDFDPNEFFRGEGVRPGITLWRDADGDDRWDPAVDALLPVLLSDGGQWQQKPFLREWTLTLTTIAALEPTIAGGFDFFVVAEIRDDRNEPSPDASPLRCGADFKLWIDRGLDPDLGPGISRGHLRFSSARPIRYANIAANLVKPVYGNLAFVDLAPERLDPTPAGDEPELHSNVIPVAGLTIAGTSRPGANPRLLEIELQALSYDGFDPNTHLAPLAGDAGSGVTLWRDSKAEGLVGIFDAAETLVPATVTAWQYRGYDLLAGADVYSCLIVPTGAISDPGTLPLDDFEADGAGVNRGLDFYLAVRSTSLLPYGSRFAFRVPDGGVKLTGGVPGVSVRAFTGREIRGNVSALITSLVAPGNPAIGASSPPVAVLRLDLDGHELDLARRTWLEGYTVEFYDRGGFNFETDLVGFGPASPVYNPADGWYQLTNLSAAALRACGVVLYRDAALTQPVIVSRYRVYTQRDVPPGYPAAPAGWQFEFQAVEPLPATLYLAVRTSATFTPGDSFDLGVVGWGLTGAEWETWGSRALPILDGSAQRTSIYARRQTGTFNPVDPGQVLLNAESGYDGIHLAWGPTVDIHPSAFLRWEIYRTDGPAGTPQLVETIYDYYDRERTYLRAPGGDLVDGVDYTFSVVMHYLHGGTVETQLASNAVTANLYLVPNNYLPDIIRVVVSYNQATEYVNRVEIHWYDRSVEPLKASGFLVERRVAGSAAWTIQGVVPIGLNAAIDHVYTFVDAAIPAATTRETSPEYRLRLLRGALPAEDDPAPVYTMSQPTAVVHVTDFDDPLFEAGGGGGCFVATAAWGTPLAPEVGNLRRFRDRVLARFAWGRRFIAFYYRHSPPAAAFIGRRPAWRLAARLCLRPLVRLAKIF